MLSPVNKWSMLVSKIPAKPYCVAIKSNNKFLNKSVNCRYIAALVEHNLNLQALQTFMDAQLHAEVKVPFFQ